MSRKKKGNSPRRFTIHDSRFTVFLSLGSNQGRPLRNLHRAIQKIRALPRTNLLRASSFYITSPVGAKNQRDFLNAAVSLSTRLSPMGLLAHLKRIEASLGRHPAKRWSPRPLDIDILFYGDRRLRSPHLMLPHPRMFQRRFVLAPLSEIQPEFSVFLRRLKAPSQSVTMAFASTKASKRRKGRL